MFVITGATGHTGSIAAQTLLAAGKKVRAVVRDRAKAKHLEGLGADIFVADLGDRAAFSQAVRGAAGVFLLSPPDLTAKDFISERKALTALQVSALAEERVPHVVLLSSVGAQHPAGTGPVLSVRNLEQQLRAAGVPSTFVRASYFVENWGAVVHPVKADGVLPSFVAADKRFAQVSTADIGKTVARALTEGPRGVRTIELAGPEDLTPNDVAATFSRILGKPVNVVEAPLGAVVPTFTAFGMSDNMAGLFRQMYEAVGNGLLTPEPGGEHVRGSTPLETTLRALLG